ncbi:MAG TPA: glycosyltransferase family 4 protein [Acidimicrobiales bacterium]|nr:glycosyltransferase family 4 protein [Acidimicrobiales bacterium]
MRAVVVVTDTGRGGTPNRMAAVAGGLARRGWEILFVSVKPGGQVLGELSGAGMATASLELRSSGGGAAAVWRVRRLIRHWHPAIVQSALWHANLAAGLAAVGTSIPVVAGHQSVDDTKPAHRVVIDRLTLRRLATRHVAVSEAVADRLAARERVPRSRVTVIPGGKDPGRWAPAGRRDEVRGRYGIPLDARVVGWSGRLHPVKAVPALVAAVALLDGWWLVLVGGGEDEARIRRSVEDADIGNRVVMTGELADVAPLLEALDVFCLPSAWEGMPGALLEAMAAGLPVVATRVGGVGEVVDHGVSGLLVAPGDVAALAGAIASALEQPELGRHAQEAVQNRFSETVMIDAYDRLWREVAG